MRYFLAVVAFFSFVFVACKHNADPKCQIKETIAQPGDTYYELAWEYCLNPQQAEWDLIDLNPYPAGNIPVGARIVFP